MTVYEYLRSIDNKYGSQEHQRAFLARMTRAQALHPCTKDHTGETPPIHRTSCYPKDQYGRMIGS
jgi:hypothetical protein